MCCWHLWFFPSTSATIIAHRSHHIQNIQNNVCTKYKICNKEGIVSKTSKSWQKQTSNGGDTQNKTFRIFFQIELSMVMHAFNSSTQKAETGRSKLTPAWSTHSKFQASHGYREILSQRNKGVVVVGRRSGERQTDRQERWLSV